MITLTNMKQGFRKPKLLAMYLTLGLLFLCSAFLPQSTFAFCGFGCQPPFSHVSIRPMHTIYNPNYNGTIRALDVSGVSYANGAKIQIYRMFVPTTDNQEFYLYGSYNDAQIVAVHSNKCLDITSNSTYNGALLQQWDCIPNALNQRFTISQTTLDTNQFYTFYIHPRNNGQLLSKCLDVVGGSTANTTLVQQWDCNYSASAKHQRFMLYSLF